AWLSQSVTQRTDPISMKRLHAAGRLGSTRNPTHAILSVQPQEDLFDLLVRGPGARQLPRDAEAHLLKNTPGRRMIHHDARIQWPLAHLGEQLAEGCGRNPLAPVFSAVPIGDLTASVAQEAADITGDGPLALDRPDDAGGISQNLRPVPVELRTL